MTQFTDERLVAKTRKGKIRQYRRRKLQNRALANAYATLGQSKRAHRIDSCSNWFDFDVIQHADHIEHRVVRASNCRERLCPNCMPIRSSRLLAGYKPVFERLLEDYPKRQYLLATFTIPAVLPQDLQAAISALSRGYSNLSRRREFKRAVKGSMRSIETNFNPRKGTFNPHIHAALMMDDSYFVSDSPVYITADRWRKIWNQVMVRDDITQIDLKPVLPRFNSDYPDQHPMIGMLLELTKYVTKPGGIFQWTKNGWHVEPDLLADLHDGLKGRHLIATTGAIRKTALALNVSAGEPEFDKPPSVEDSVLLDNPGLIMETYKWSSRHEDFLLSKRAEIQPSNFDLGDIKLCF